MKKSIHFEGKLWWSWKSLGRSVIFEVSYRASIYHNNKHVALGQEENSAKDDTNRVRSIAPPTACDGLA